MLRSRDAGAIPAAPFARILCAVDGSLGSQEATRQAIRLARGNPSAALRFVTARHDRGQDASLPSDLTEMQARNALELALATARHADLDAEVSLLRGRPPADLLLEAATGADLLALGGSRRPTSSTVRLGATATRVTEEASCVVLLAHPGAGWSANEILAVTGGLDRLREH